MRALHIGLFFGIFCFGQYHAANANEISVWPRMVWAQKPDRYGDGILYMPLVPAPKADETMMMFEIPISFRGEDCADRPLPFFQTYGYNDPEAPPVGQSSFELTLWPDLGVVSVTVLARPFLSPEHIRRADIRLVYPLLDKIPGDACVKGRIYNYRARIYIDRLNTIIEIATDPSPFAPVYVSPINMGTNADVRDGSVGIWSFHLNSIPYFISGLKAPPNSMFRFGYTTWTKVRADHNRYYGAQAYPIPAPFLGAGNAASALVHSLFFGN